MIYLTFPNTDWQDPPDGDYYVLDYDDLGWPNTSIVPHPQFPIHVKQFFEEGGFHPFPLVPLSEEGVLASGLINSEVDIEDSFQLFAAVACTSRSMQRRLLPDRLNPKWGAPGSLEGKQVVKSCASSLSIGVHVIDSKLGLESAIKRVTSRACADINRLRRVGEESPPIVEEFLEGPAYEIDGVCGPRGLEFCFNGLNQKWSGEKIIEYSVVENSIQLELEDLAQEITNALAMRRCGFSIELRSDPWKVIEVNGRIGEDSDPFYSLLSPDKNPMQVLYDICSRRT